MLEVDLSTGKYNYKDVTDIFREYIGGTGALTFLAKDELTKELDPYSSQASIYFGIGPFNNLFPTASKTVAIFKSPLTGDLGESHAGGRFALAMQAAGIHVLKVTGKSNVPVYLSIDNDEIRLTVCNSIWGRSALSTERILREKEDIRKGKKSIIRIGPAGERLSPISCVTVDASRHFGRLGLGGVMGSKNLKAIVISGNRYQKIENRSEYQKLYNEIFRELVSSENTLKYRDLGTAVNVVPLSMINGLPTRNFSQGYFESAERISGEYFAENLLAQQIACAHCPIGCIHMGIQRELFVSPHMYRTIKVSYDHELIYSLGSNLSISKAEDILKLIHFVERQGWDAISIGVTLAWATEAFQRGLVTVKETNGIALSFGDTETYLKVLEKISKGENEFFRDLEMGVDYCSKKYGGEEFAIAFNKNEAPGYVTGPNAFVGYAVGIRHSHLDCAGYSVDQRNIKNFMSVEKQVDAMFEESVWRMVTNSLVLCLFARGVYTQKIVERGLKLLGYDVDIEKIVDIGKKIHKLKYELKKRMGFDFEKLKFPKKLERVYTSNGMISEKDFRDRVKLYAKKIFNE